MRMLAVLSDIFSRAGLNHRPYSLDKGEELLLDPQGKTILSLTMHVYPNAQTSLIQNFAVGRNYRGSEYKVGGTAIKTIAANLSQEGIETIELFKVRDDGLTFWPAHGALPLNNEDLPNILSCAYDTLPKNHDDRMKIAEALRMPGDFNEMWFCLTDRQSGVSRTTLEKINTALSLDRTMTLELERPVVRRRLGLHTL